MTDPYQILGVGPNATDDEVKAAYREMAHKYHPDNYANNPLADLASEKMKEINEAYDAITAQRKSGAGYNGGSSGGGAYNGAASSQFADIRRMIQSGRSEDAAELLDGIPAARRDAEWYFLKGSVLYSRGWLDQAYRNMSQAVSMAPQNPEYRAAMNQMSWQRNNGTNQTQQYRGAQPPAMGGCNGCDMCQSLICADCCCECMGGDLINCC